jgi:hypothetical protein
VIGNNLDEWEEWIDKALEADPLDLDLDEIDEPLASTPPLSARDIAEARLSLARWHNPAEFKVETDALCARCKSRDWFNNPHLKFLHDAFVLARFAHRKSVDSVRLAESSEQWPDGYVRLDGKQHSIEVTSTHGGRALGKEYRDVKGPAMDPVENWIARADSIPKYLDEAINAKSKKRYSSPCWLVVYLNIGEWGIRQKETEIVISETKERYAPAFEAISVLWKGRIY